MRKKRSISLLLTALFAAVTLVFGATNAFALLKVNVMPSGVSSPVNVWDSKPYTWPGNSLELWGNVKYDGTLALTYTWTFGDSTPNTTGTVPNKNNIAATHVYGSLGSNVATLTVTARDAGGNIVASDSDTVYIDVVPQTVEIKKNLAIQRALKYLYSYKSSSATGACSYNNWDNNIAYTGLAVLAFEDHGHRARNDRDRDIFAETVQNGLNYLFAKMRGYAASVQNTTHTDSDINSNSRKVDAGTGDMYYNGIVPMALANSADPTAIVSCGSAEVNGKTYKTVLEDLVDYIAYAQEERTNTAGLGGWRYAPNYWSSDNSVSQWPVLGLAAAEGDPFNIHAPDWVKTQLRSWVNYSQKSNGGYVYASDYFAWENVGKTAAGIISMTYAGNSGNLQNARDFINSNWNINEGIGGTVNIGDHYAMYAVKKGLQYAGIKAVGTHDWQQEYNQWYVNNQASIGTNGTNGVTWPSSGWFGQGNISTAFGLLVLAPGLVELPPVASAGPDQEASAGTAVSFDGSASHHTDPTRQIATYEWDFNFDGTTVTPDATGVSVTNTAGYTLPAGVDNKTFTVALRVTDNSTPPRTALDTAIVTVSNGNVSPVAVPGGPYLGAVGLPITLDGSASYDINAAGGSNPIANPATPSGFDQIVKYQWDLDGDGVYGAADGEPEGAVVTVNFGPNFIGTKNIGLKVTDSFGRSSQQSIQATTVAVSNLQPLCYTNTINSYNRLTGKWTVGWKMKLQNLGNVPATNVKARLTGSSIPAGVTVLDDNLAWAGSVDASEIQLSDDEFRYIYARTGLDLTKITWDIEFTDSLGNQRVIRNIPQNAGSACQ